VGVKIEKLKPAAEIELTALMFFQRPPPERDIHRNHLQQKTHSTL